MAKKPRVIVTQESDTGRNLRYKDTKTGEKFTTKQFAKAINKKSSVYADDYHTRMINGISTPCSNPNNTTNDNLD